MRRERGKLAPDTVSDVLGTLRFQSMIFCRSILTAPWGFSVAKRRLASFHFIERGRCFVDVEDSSKPTSLGAGDLVILPNGHRHAIRDVRESEAPLLDDLLGVTPVGPDLVFRYGGGGSETSIICGGFAFEDATALAGLPALPPVLHIRALDRPGAHWLRLAQDLIARELTEGSVGANAIAARLADVLLIEALRSHFSDSLGEPSGWVAALRDPNIGTVLDMIHRAPEREWTVASLASRAGMSRSAFALRFSVLLGEPPIRYLARLRIHKAIHLLRASRASVGEIAESVGYDSEAAFGRAFRRHVGISPAALRRAQLPSG